MLDAIKPLLENGIVNEDTAKAINEAWESKLNEAREEVKAELREEFSRKYDHDKQVMVEALDKMVTAGLEQEIAEFYEERKAMNEDRVRAQQSLKETSAKFNNFMITKLAEEISELRSDRQRQTEGRKKLEKFVVESLARELREFSQDKRAVVEAKVKLVAEAKQQLTALKAKFISESAQKVKVAVTRQLQGEMQQLREDIKIARENDFGRRLFEAYATEFSASHLNEKAETRKLMKQIEETQQQLAESRQQIAEKQQLVESKEREVRIIKESNIREKTMTELLGTLNEEKAETMRSLLESVQTPKLKVAFDKYLPAVLNTATSKQPAAQKQTIVEGAIKEVTGDKSAVKREDEIEDNLIDFKRLAGL